MQKLDWFFVVLCSSLIGLMVGVIAFGEPNILTYLAIATNAGAIFLIHNNNT